MSSAADLRSAAAKRFSPASTPRSTQYREGWIAAQSIRRGRGFCPYELGTASADAWFAGYDEGLSLAGRCADCAAPVDASNGGAA